MKASTASKALRHFLAVLTIASMVYFFSAEFRKHWASLAAYHLQLNLGYLAASLFVMLLSLLIDTYTWQVCLNHYLETPINLFESISLFSTSNLFKYVPGRIWTYTMQIALMANKNISKALVAYINLICIICSLVVSAAYGLYFVTFYLKFTPVVLSCLLFSMLLFVDLLFVEWNEVVINRLISLLNRIFTREIKLIVAERRLIIYIQLLSLLSMIPYGVSAFFLAGGIGLKIEFSNVFALMASVSVSWMAGYLAIIAPGGLGIREGVMYAMLRQFCGIEAALILPIASRLMQIVGEGTLGTAGFLLSLRYRALRQSEKPVAQNDER